MAPRSLASRLLVVMGLWLTVALLVTGILLSTLFRNNAESNFQGLLLAHAYNLMGAIDINDKGELTGTPNLGDPRFLTPLSGWYWSVSAAKTPQVPALHSASITDEKLGIPSTNDKPFNKLFRRTYDVNNGPEITIQHLEAQLYLGESDTLYQVLVAGNKSKIEEAISDFNRTLLMFFTAFGLGTILASYFAIRFGLKPLGETARALHEIRDGKSEVLQGTFPREIEPLAEEINALIEANKSVTERARTQVGNLAHALKTPLAVIQNEVRKPNKGLAKKVDEQTKIMQSQITTYLDRARIAAQRGVIGHRTPVTPIVEKIARVVQKLSPDIKVNWKSNEEEIVFKGEEQDLEEVVGNLLENAARFAKSEVVLTLSPVFGKKVEFFQLVIEDDGPGISENNRNMAMQRGKRLDETNPGSGLGLSIVQDIASEYGGNFELTKSSSGGLRAVVFLPRIEVS
ncbi:MAG: HAMP domain-containing sensor histidine kinase [Rhizobiaceae bacterium]